MLVKHNFRNPAVAVTQDQGQGQLAVHVKFSGRFHSFFLCCLQSIRRFTVTRKSLCMAKFQFIGQKCRGKSWRSSRSDSGIKPLVNHLVEYIKYRMFGKYCPITLFANIFFSIYASHSKFIFRNRVQTSKWMNVTVYVYLYVCMYVCTYVCMCIYVFMYVTMQARIQDFTQGG